MQDNSLQKLVYNDNYYRHIFKKTEKIVSVVFYILNNVESNKKTETHVSNLAGKAHFVHEHALRTLEARASGSKEVLEQFAQALIALDSSLQIAAVAGLVPLAARRTIDEEIDIVLRGLKSYLAEEHKVDETFLTYRGDALVRREPAASATKRRPVVLEEKRSEPTSSHDRRERIKTIIEAKGEATIRDISLIITDISEKTIQRELQSMIDGNIVKRQGERRWSKYSLV